ncbi:hypothetical protein B0H12DRAFT_1110932 [Mycena haematopus]|nr:hypothetical protein B0H12DRAFT_1110932 [Mycena haematopus]
MDYTKKKDELESRMDAMSLESSAAPEIAMEDLETHARTQFQSEPQELTYQQKKDVCLEIAQLNGPRLEKVVKIIVKACPALQQASMFCFMSSIAEVQ